MKILVTNWRLARRTGSELHAAELARDLRSRGHEVALYAPVIGEMADQLRADRFLVANTPSELSDAGFNPEIIHAQHHMSAIAALSHFPHCHAVYQCHGTAPWEEWPPLHPRIAFYCVPSSEFNHWLTEQHQIPPDRIRIVPLSVDLSAYPVKNAIQWPPKRALIFSDYFERGPELDAIAAVCRERDIKLDAKGRGFGSAVDAPDKLLPQYDLVFAAGRSAIEALACGCATILVRERHMEDWIHPGNLRHAATLNFSPGIDTKRPITEETIAAALDRVTESAIAETARLIRSEHELNTAVDTLEKLYQDALSEPLPLEKEDHHLIRYVEKIAPYILQADDKFRDLRSGWERTKEKRRDLAARLEQKKAEHEAFVDFLSHSRQGRALLRVFERSHGKES